MASETKDVFKTLEPLEYYRSFIEGKIRPDGRDLLETRQTFLNIGYITCANGSAMVKLGETVVICGIKAELAQPSPELPNEGFIVPNIDLPPLCASFFKPGPPSEVAQVFSQQIYDLIESSGCILKEDLCIKQGKLAWCLYIDIICLNYDGSIIDACVLALTAALLNTTLPLVKVGEDNERICVEDEKERLKVHCKPVSLSFTIFDSKHIIADPTKEEELWCTGMFNIVALEDGSLCSVNKPGGCAISNENLYTCISHTKKRSKELQKLLNETVATLNT